MYFLVLIMKFFCNSQCSYFQDYIFHTNSTFQQDFAEMVEFTDFCERIWMQQHMLFERFLSFGIQNEKIFQRECQFLFFVSKFSVKVFHFIFKMFCQIRIVFLIHKKKNSSILCLKVKNLLKTFRSYRSYNYVGEFETLLGAVPNLLFICLVYEPIFYSFQWWLQNMCYTQARVYCKVPVFLLLLSNLCMKQINSWGYY
eukprot:TRINITY_DN2112_c0_g1_i1.p3 TRINITY_DN2112_c0_g1~~TRINITY_DN2112_c0_g1_i1.p3  ORF type:complete len:199 (+),score=-8.09 TRINITY_DN2112_c0_g1_i1:217-813(+)